MATEMHLDLEFPPVDAATWRQAVEADLKGAAFEKRMVSTGYDGIAVPPLHTEASFPTAQDPAGLPGFAPFARAATPLGNTRQGWAIEQQPDHPDPARANAQLLDDLASGGSAVSLRLDAAGRHGLDADAAAAGALRGEDGVMLSSRADLARVLERVRPDIAGVWLQAGAAFLPAAALHVAAAEAAGVPAAALAGGLGADPLGALLAQGSLPVPVEQALAELADLACWTEAQAPRMVAAAVNGAPWHDAGADAVQDLAFLIGTGLEYLRAMTEAGLTVDAAARQIRFNVSVGTRFWLAIAKLRAARVLWAAVVAASGGSAAGGAMRLRVVTGRRVLTRRSQKLNILRNTVATYAAALAGAEAITTVPFDAPCGISTPQSRRNARNTQLVLAEECHLARVIDPTGGSWYVEWHTGALAERAWALLQQIEAQGGMAAAAGSGWVAEQVAAVQARRAGDIASRRLPITGISEHAGAEEFRTAQEAPDRAALGRIAAQRLAEWRRAHAPAEALAALAAAPAAGGRTALAIAAARAGATLGELAAALVPPGALPATVAALPVTPYDAAFDALRDAAEAFAARRGRPPLVWLAGVGSIAEQTGRRIFAQNFFAAGGFEVRAADTAADVDAAAAAFAGSGAAIAVICSTDKRYPEVVGALAPKLRAAGASHVLLAGHPGAAEAQYRAAGVDGFIHVRSDVVDTLTSLLRAEEAVA